jgi:predicted ThiF/HesA family dinucleotide-utilizing enzyme
MPSKRSLGTSRKLATGGQADPATEKAIRAALSKGREGIHKIAVRFGVGTGTVQRIEAEMARPDVPERRAVGLPQAH